MIKVHCFVSCVCELLKKQGIDHRPYYFGVWDADFFVDATGALTYHSDNIDHSFFKEWYETLYGITLQEWYDDTTSKAANVATFLRILEEKEEDSCVMVMLDLALLPERENKFQQSPFPHYVMIEQTEHHDEWMMYDPDFRWEGRINKQLVLAAIASPDVGGGYLFSSREIRPPTDETVEAYFRTCMKEQTNPLTNAVQAIVDSFWQGSHKERLSDLPLALKQLPVLAIRKYAYEHAFAFFWFKLQFTEATFDYWCDKLKREHGFKAIHYRAMKLAKTQTEQDYNHLCAQLNEQNLREKAIKHQLVTYFDQWLLVKPEKELQES
ncbi:LOW QUALITY PROTEIN: hypothetical protein JCM19046_4750 [Bacillus sp. JCM 19046]|nr:LOW QUALITY PROTEIN: hypothetical protein JCM19046_4750 [Bacillus sp. JCM 19046]